MTDPSRLSATEATSWLGAEITELNGGMIGQVQGFYLDAEDGEPVWVVARLGRRRRARVVALPVATCAGAPFGVWVAQEGDAIRSAPVVDPTRPLRREHELTVCAHFGIGEKTGRAKAVMSRGEGDTTAVPAG